MAKKTTFVVKESKFSAGVKRRWRFPRGKHSKVRQMHKGRPALPGPGYGSPKATWGLDKSGLMPILVKHDKDLLALDKEKQGVIIASVGMKKKVSLIEKAEALGLTILNVKDSKSFIQGIKDIVAERKKASDARKKGKAKKATDAKKKAEKAEEKTEAKADEKKETPKAEEKKPEAKEEKTQTKE